MSSDEEELRIKEESDSDEAGFLEPEVNLVEGTARPSGLQNGNGHGPRLKIRSLNDIREQKSPDQDKVKAEDSN